MGVRIALGATGAEIRRGAVGDGVRLTAMGLGVGLVGAVGVGRLISAVLYGVRPFDPVTLGGVLVLFLGVAALASFVPAARASTTDPITVLRTD
jgi:ABC-type antimicrobial peptide transport system permease subunit